MSKTSQNALRIIVIAALAVLVVALALSQGFSSTAAPARGKPPTPTNTPYPTSTPGPSPTPVPTNTPASGGPTILDGSFIQPSLSGWWTTANFATEYGWMNGVRMNHEMWQWTVDSSARKMCTYYPSAISAFPKQCQRNGRGDPVYDSLIEAQKAGLVVWLGLNWSDEWWNNYANDNAWLTTQFGYSKQIAQELWNRYGGAFGNTIAGFYMTMEMDNLNFQTQVTQDRMAYVYKDVADYVHANTGKPVMVAPFFNETLGQNATQYAAMWGYILTTAPIDIVALQDGVGVGHASVATVGPWFSAMKNAILAARPSTQLWSDLETMTGSSPAPTQRIIDQINAERPYVYTFTSFAFNHYQSPQQGFTTQYNEYKAYVDTQP
jgi:hypothetical protein